MFILLEMLQKYIIITLTKLPLSCFESRRTDDKSAYAIDYLLMLTFYVISKQKSCSMSPFSTGKYKVI